MSKAELQETLKSCFPNLEEDALLVLVEHASFLKSSKGTKLIFEGRKQVYFYLILKGGVKSYYSKESKDVCVWLAFENEDSDNTCTAATHQTLRLGHHRQSRT